LDLSSALAVDRIAHRRQFTTDSATPLPARPYCSPQAPPSPSGIAGGLERLAAAASPASALLALPAPALLARLQ